MSRRGAKRPANSSDLNLSGIKSMLHKIENYIDKLDEQVNRPRESTSSLVLECPVCLQDMNLERGTSSTICGHVFCTPCILRALILIDQKCPTCRKPLRTNQIHKIFLIGPRSANWYIWHHLVYPLFIVKLFFLMTYLYANIFK